MKKVYRTILICMMIILSAFVLAACGKKDAGKKTTTESSTEASEDVASTEDTTEATTEAQVDEEGFTIVNDKVTTTDYVNVRIAPSTDGDPAMQLADGVDTLDEGANKLNEGMIEFNEEGIRKLTDAFDGDISSLLDRVNAVMDAGKDYNNFSGVADGKSSSVKFIIKTEGVKAE